MRFIVEKIEALCRPVAVRLEQKNISLPIDLASGIVMALFALFILLTMDTQIPVGENHVVNGRAFPSLLMWILLICSAYLILKDAFKVFKGQSIERKNINMLVEVKALIIFLIFLGTYFIASLTDIFLLGALFCVFAFLIFFKCKKNSYYLIASLLAVLIYIAFYFGLNVRF